jgi:hypothetical protein
MAETVTSMVEPEAAKAGRLAVTITAATSLVCIWDWAARVFTPSRSSMATRLCWVIGAFSRLSPVPFNPTTRP